MTNELLVNRYLNYQKREGKAVLSLSAYATDLKQFLSFLSSPLPAASPQLVKAICQKLTGGLKPNAAARKLTTLRSFLSWGYRGGYIKKDLAGVVGRPKRKTMSGAKPLTASQIARLRRTATVQERLLLELILQTGMRLPQILSLKMKHLKIGRHREESAAADDAAISGGSLAMTQARIPISGMLRQSLDYYLAAVTRGPRSYLLVSARTGRPPGTRAAGMMLAKLGKRAGVRGVTPRNLRATLIGARARIRT